MTDGRNPKLTKNVPSSAPTNPPKISGNGHHYPNPPEHTNPDAATLREQWKFAIRQYSKWYSHAWGTAILAGLSFYALGWIIKGSNPLPSFNRHELLDTEVSPSLDDHVAAVPEVKPSS